MSKFTMLDYSKLNKAFDKIYITVNGNVHINAKNVGDKRKNSIAFVLYANKNEFYWRRKILMHYSDVRLYQLFRTYDVKASKYIWTHFNTVDEAIEKLKEYLAKLN